MPEKPGFKSILNRTLEALLPLAAVLLAFLVGAVVLLLMRVDPIKAYGALLQGAAGNVSGLTQTLVKATPLLLVGLGVTIAFRGGVINIGGEGQLLVGALATTAVAIGLKDWPGYVLLPVCILTGAAAGALWAAFPVSSRRAWG